MTTPVDHPRPLASARVLLQASWTRLRQHARTLVVLMLPPMLILGFVQKFLDPESSFFATGSAAVGWGVVAIVGIIWGLLAYVATIRTLAQASELLSVRTAYQQSFRFVLPVLGVSILMGLINIGGLLLFIIPGLIWAIWYSFAPYVVVAEQSRVVDGLRTSRHYVAGRFWAVVGRLTVLALLMGGAMLAGIVVAVVIGLIIPLFDGPTLANELLATVLLSVILLPVQLYGVVYTYQLYDDLRTTR